VSPSLTGKVALVTGSSRGIGRAIAERLAERGAAVVLTARSPERLAEAAAELTRGGRDVLALPADVAEEADVARLFAAIRDRFGVLHYLVNNAGIARDGPVQELTTDDFLAVLRSHVLGTFLCSRAALPLMPKGSRILNVGAASANTGRRFGSSYCAAKAGVMALTRCLAIECAPDIAVNCLVPGWTETEEIVGRFHLDDPETRRRLESGILLGRLAHPDEIAAWAVYLLTEAPYVTGQLFYVNGGSYLG
jgi:3-oxoacyl-[acyl-carrier protein] reductase